MKRDCFIFDLDGTLLNTLPDLVVLTNTVLEEFGYPTRTTAQILGYVGNGARALMYQAVPFGTPDHEANQALARWKQLYPKLGHACTRPYDGIVPMLDELGSRGCALGVLSNKFDAAVKEVIEHHFPGVFLAVHGESEGFPRKPDPTGLLATVAELRTEPSRCVYVGDSPGDMQTAHNAGVFALAVDWGYRSVKDLQSAGFDALVSHPRQIVELVQ